MGNQCTSFGFGKIVYNNVKDTQFEVNGLKHCSFGSFMGQIDEFACTLCIGFKKEKWFQIALLLLLLLVHVVG